MTALKRILQICVLSACVLSPTVVFADEVVSNPQTAQAPSLQEGIDFARLGTPEPINLSCTATSACTPVGGVPLTCTGSGTCSSGSLSVSCDGTITYCTCNPSGVPTCYDPVGFCNCWNQSPSHNWGACRQGYCFEP